MIFDVLTITAVPDAPNTVVIPEYSGETRLLQRLLLNLTEPVSIIFIIVNARVNLISTPPVFIYRHRDAYPKNYHPKLSHVNNINVNHTV